MAGESDRRRFWSDGHGIYHIATFGERAFAGFVDWAVALFVVGAVGASVTVYYVYATAETSVGLDGRRTLDLNWYVFGMAETGGILLYEPVVFMVATIVHLVSAIMLARGINILGYRAFRLRVKRDNLDSLGVTRCVLHKFVGSPGLVLPYVLIVLLGLLFGTLKSLDVLFDQRIDLLGILSDPVTGIWSVGVDVYWILAPVLVVLNHVWILKTAKGRAPHDIMLDTVVIQDRILSTNRAAFPSTGRAPVERWD